MLNSKLFSRFVILISFFIGSVLTVFGMWNVDLSISSMLLQQALQDAGFEATTIHTNGWYAMTPLQAYHVGLYEILAGMLFTAFVFSYYFIYASRKDGKEDV